MSRLLKQITGTSADRLFNTLQIRPIRLRYGAREITPTPLIEYLGPTPLSEIGSELGGSESFAMWRVSIPVDTLLAVFGGSESAFLVALQPNQLWEVLPNATEGWVTCRTFEAYQVDASERYGFRLARLGFNDPVS